MENFIVISGCSGGGKSTLVEALAARGFHTVPEPGRRVVEAELASGGTALPWQDMNAFLETVIALARDDYEMALSKQGWVLFDRGLVDGIIALQHLRGGPVYTDHLSRYRYGRVFLAPPWPEIFQTDDARRHDYGEAKAEFARLARAYPRWGYRIDHIPKRTITDRVTWMLNQISP